MCFLHLSTIKRSLWTHVCLWRATMYNTAEEIYAYCQKKNCLSAPASCFGSRLKRFPSGCWKILCDPAYPQADLTGVWGISRVFWGFFFHCQSTLHVASFAAYVQLCTYILLSNKKKCFHKKKEKTKRRPRPVWFVANFLSENRCSDVEVQAVFNKPANEQSRDYEQEKPLIKMIITVACNKLSGA